MDEGSEMINRFKPCNNHQYQFSELFEELRCEICKVYKADEIGSNDEEWKRGYDSGYKNGKCVDQINLNILADKIERLIERIVKLEEHHTRQIDENRKVSHILDNLDRFSNSLDERIEKLENSLEEADLKNLYDTTFFINGNYAHKNLVAHHYIEITKRLEKLETFAANPHAFDITTKYVFPNKPEKPECQHEWDTNLLLSNPPKTQCKKCKFIKTFENYSMSEAFNHPRDTLQLCKHGAPVKTCTACY